MILRRCLTNTLVFIFTNVPSYHSRACGIEDNEEDSFIITGGYVSNSYKDRVTKYYRNGSYDDMPALNTARSQAACGSYKNTNWQTVF